MIHFSMRRDDFSISRLFFQLQHVGGLVVHSFRWHKPNVLMMLTNVGPKVLKGYQSPYKLKAQLALADHVRTKGLSSFASFERFPSGAKKVEAEGVFWGVMPFIPQMESKRFHFGTVENRKAGLEVLATFHEYATEVDSEILRLLPAFSLFTKWETRYEELVNRKKLLERLIGVETTANLLEFGSIFFRNVEKEKLKKIEKDAEKEGTVIHGDCASHNFIRASNGDLVLIDFDLCANAPQSYDFLQFAHRILPYLDWSLNTLKDDEQFTGLIKEKWFVIALVYPADLYREWNKLLRRKASSRKELENLSAFTRKEIDRRQSLLQEVKFFMK